MNEARLISPVFGFLFALLLIFEGLWLNTRYPIHFTPWTCLIPNGLLEDIESKNMQFVCYSQEATHSTPASKLRLGLVMLHKIMMN
jgi:hypothetical protein